ncbi:lipopolysaccharide biosynthesis protein [Janthinobacterium rivuli]|uniref:lipopolysaccharide biosynthesis protein n=1 Tax=Janthinobacterium rivuli TaxID=2751478 RepID=UPI00383AD6B7
MHNEVKKIEGDDIDENVLSVADLLKTIWQGRRTLLVITLLTVAAGLAGRMLFSEYKSEGFFQFGGTIPMVKKTADKDKDKEKEPSPGIKLADYKRYAAAFKSNERFTDFLVQHKLEQSPSTNALRRSFASREGISKWIDPVFPFTKLDAKELLEDPKDGNNNVIGLRISYDDKDPKVAQSIVGLLGRYTQDTIVYIIYSDILRFKHVEMTAKITALDNEIIENNERLAHFRRSGDDLKKIVTRYPDAAGQASRQVVSISDETARYLPPVTQLMTTEVLASEAMEKIHKARREQQQNILLREYYDKAKTLVDNTKSGEDILRGLEPVKTEVFKDKNMEDDTVKEVFNQITIDNQTAISLYLEKSRFIAGPSLPENLSLRLSVTVLFSLFIGLMLSFAVIFGRKSLQEN